MTKIIKLLAAACVANFLIGSAAMAVYMPHLPPAEFDRPANNMRVWHYSPAKVDDLCRRLVSHQNNPYRFGVAGGVFHACAVGGTEQCILIMPARPSVTKASYDRLYRHERAHCNGWRD
jgi:hypothetical protein